MTQLTELHRRELARCIKFIEAVGCKFKIITPDGDEFGELHAVEEKPRVRAPRKYPYGAVAGWFRPRLNVNAAIGDVQVVDCGEFPPDDVRSGICSELHRVWGRETYTTAINGNAVEILRVA